MRKLGLIGGVGPEATIPYYHGIVYGVQKEMNESVFPHLTIESLSCFELIPMSAQGKRKELKEYLLSGVQSLVAAGADFGALACNTAHMVFEELKAECPIPLVSIIDVTLAEAQRLGIKKAGLLGTEATMNDDFFSRPFEEAGIKIVTPGEEEKTAIAKKIFEELELGIVKSETINLFCGIVDRMVKDDEIEAIILGCTEIPLVFQDVTLPVPRLDTMEIHIKALVKEILADT
ncbi:aspartate/glutamate racemase family protein [Faecalicatena orotica]|uniref:aspartate/glutamate racemase family protein n=1 Tax=Faecalicatena orotica TaxID=1544 RepID=UPI0032168620